MDKEPEQNAMAKPKKSKKNPTGRPKKYITWKMSWTLEDKKKLFAAMRMFASSDVKLFQNYLPHKDPKDIATYVRHLRQFHIQRKLSTQAPVYKFAPIDYWLRTAENLVFNHVPDLSLITGKVIKSIGIIEHGPPREKTTVSKKKKTYTKKNPDKPPPPDTNMNAKPDYSIIYSYLAALFNRKPAPVLNCLESKVIMSLVDDLLQVLKVSNLEQITEMMVKKFTLLNKPWDNDQIRMNHNDVETALRVGSTPVTSSSAERKERGILSIFEPMLLDEDEDDESDTELIAENNSNEVATETNNSTECEDTLDRRRRSTRGRESTDCFKVPGKHKRRDYLFRPYSMSMRKMASRFYTMNPLQVSTELLPIPKLPQ
ncbi:uncharacterized protein LOC141907312 [Tubulanus polymorphus]|uniref:uncharacterized protein LOC141907312 n=1 Tax=Tubulanus polymorphus TaxID=672921 RepID=UPI003DA28C95